MTISATILFLVALRLAGLCLVAPVLSHWAVPVRLRLMAAIAMSLAVVSSLVTPPALPLTPGTLLAAGVMELLIGAAIGYAARLVFVGIEMAAGYIGQQMGVGLVEALNPLGEESEGGSVRSLMGMLAIVIFLAIGGHRAMISALLDSFQAAPIASLSDARPMLTLLTGLLASSFELALRVAGPALVTLLLATVATGLLQRSALSLNLLSVGLPVQAMLGLLALAGAMAVLGGLVESAWNGTNGSIQQWLRLTS